MNRFLISLFFVIYLFSSSLKAIDIITEVVSNFNASQKQSARAEAYGNLFINYEEPDKFLANLQYEFKDQEHRLNVVSVKFSLGMADISIGRQLFAWGTGYNFNPTDIFNAKPLGAAFDPTYIKTGRDAVMLTVYPMDNTSLDVILAPQFNRSDTFDQQVVTQSGTEDFGLRLKTNLFDYDVAITYTSLGERTYNSNGHKNDNLYGLAVKGSLPIYDIGVWLEAVKYYYQQKYEVTVGLEYFYESLVFNLEYYKNNWGKKDKSSYDENLLLASQVLAQEYVIPSIACYLDEKTTFTVFDFHNLNDKSNIL
ncbi:hypothetical protein ACFLZV_00805, partial [Candidatus Margulisiibacteriota bacterium]